MDPKDIVPGRDDRFVVPPSAPVPKKGRRVWILIAILFGIFFGVAGVGALGWFWAKNYVESPEFLRHMAQKAAGPEFSASSQVTELRLAPPTLFFSGLAIQKDSAKTEKVKILSARQFEILLSPWALLAGVADLRINALGLEMQNSGESSSANAVKSKNSFRLPEIPALPVRRVDLSVSLSDAKLPIAYLPKSDIELRAVLHSSSTGATMLEVQDVRAYGVQLSGKAQWNAQGVGSLQLELPVKESILSGTISGVFSPAIQLKGQLKLPNTTIGIPRDAKWLIGSKPFALTGSATLGGGGAFEWNAASWKADATVDLDLGSAAAQYGLYEKPKGRPASIKGSFSGNAVSWKLSGATVVLGSASATLNAESSGDGMRVQASVQPFEIAEFMPLLLQPDESKRATPHRISGRASADVDLRLPEGKSEPAGTVQVQMQDWSLDGETLLGIAGTSAVELDGHLKLGGQVKAVLDKGAFREGSVSLKADATGLGIRRGEEFSKKSGIPLLLDVSGEGTGRALAIKAFRLDGPSNLRIAAKGQISDLKDYVAKLQITEGRIPLATAAELSPKAGSAAGFVRLSGEIEGSLKNPDSLFTKLAWDFKNASIEHESLSVRKVNGKIETVLGAVSDAAVRPWMLQLSGISLEWQPTLVQGEELAPIAIDADGRVGYKEKELTGNVAMRLSAVDAGPYLAWITGAPQSAEKNSTAAKNSSLPALLDLRKSDFKLSISSPAIATPYLSFAQAQGVFRLGGGSDLIIEKISGKTLEGDLGLKAKIILPQSTAPYLIDLEGNGQGISMIELDRVVGKLTGKGMESSVFGKGDLEIKGKIAGGLSGADLSGRAEIREGGFKFLPAPKKVMDGLRQIKVVGDRLPVERESGKITDNLEKAQANFHLKGERMELDVKAIDSQMTMSAMGHVTLSGHCELKGLVEPKSKLVGSVVLQYLDSGIPFRVAGDQWACPVTPDYGDLATRILKSKAVEKAKEQIQEQVKGKIQDKIQDKIQGLFGK